MKNIRIFIRIFLIFFFVVKVSIYLNRRVFVMHTVGRPTESGLCLDVTFIFIGCVSGRFVVLRVLFI